MFGRLFSKKYIIGKHVSFGQITRVVVSSGGGMSRDENWSYEACYQNGQYEIRATFWDESVGEERSETKEINKKKWKTILHKLDGLVCAKKDTRLRRPMVLDASVTHLFVEWDGMPTGYETRAARGEIYELKRLMERLTTSEDEYDVRGICELLLGESGNDIGASDEKCLKLVKGQWRYTHTFCSGNGSEEILRELEVDESYVKRAGEFLNRYDWVPMQDLPMSEIQELDGSTKRFCIRFEPFQSWCLTDNKEFTEEARELWHDVHAFFEELQAQLEK